MGKSTKPKNGSKNYNLLPLRINIETLVVNTKLKMPSIIISGKEKHTRYTKTNYKQEDLEVGMAFKFMSKNNIVFKLIYEPTVT